MHLRTLAPAVGALLLLGAVAPLSASAAGYQETCTAKAWGNADCLSVTVPPWQTVKGTNVSADGNSTQFVVKVAGSTVAERSFDEGSSGNLWSNNTDQTVKATIALHTGAWTDQVTTIGIDVN